MREFRFKDDATDNPALSSLALLMRCPEESLSNEVDRSAVVRSKFRTVVSDDMLLPIVIGKTTAFRDYLTSVLQGYSSLHVSQGRLFSKIS